MTREQPPLLQARTQSIVFHHWLVHIIRLDHQDYDDFCINWWLGNLQSQSLQATSLLQFAGWLEECKLGVVWTK